MLPLAFFLSTDMFPTQLTRSRSIELEQSKLRLQEILEDQIKEKESTALLLQQRDEESVVNQRIIKDLREQLR